jgi:mannose-6-phosphate isomerase-like protein (cupin superfamily)
MKNHIIQKSAFQVPTNNNKIIKEHFGNASIKFHNVSIAHMIAPPNWKEPYQKPEFDECTLIIRGKIKIEVDGEEIILNEGESILIKSGTRVHYSNPFNTSLEYVSICIPAFSIASVNREEE